MAAYCSASCRQCGAEVPFTVRSVGGAWEVDGAAVCDCGEPWPVDDVLADQADEIARALYEDDASDPEP